MNYFICALWIAGFAAVVICGEASLSTVLWAFPAGVAAGKAAEEIQDARQRRKWRANEPF